MSLLTRHIRFLQTVKGLEGDLAAGQVLVEAQRKQLKESEESVDNYRLELEQRRSQIGELIQTVADLRQNLADKEAEIKAANEQLTLLHNAQTTSRTEAENLQSSVKRLSLQLDAGRHGRGVELAYEQRISVTLPPPTVNSRLYSADDQTLEHEAQELAGQIRKLTSELEVTKIDLETKSDELEVS